MSSPLETLNELRDKLGDLPSRVADALQQAELPAPAQGEPFTVAAAEATQDALKGISQDVPQQAASFEMPQPVPYEPGSVQPSPYETASSPSAAMAGYEAPSITPDSGLGQGMTPAASSVDSGLSPANPGRGEQGEVLSLLRELLDRREGQGQQAVQGRVPPSPRKVQWSHVWEAPQENYAGGASPSMDVSNIAGTGGASSRRGYGSYGHPGRYWASETDTEVPR